MCIYVYKHKGILFKHKKEWSLATCDICGPWGHYAKWNESDKGQILYDLIYMWNLKKRRRGELIDTGKNWWGWREWWGMSVPVCVQLDVTLWTLFHQAPLSFIHGIFQARILEQVAISYSRGSSWPKDQTCISWVSCIGRWFFTTEPPGKPMEKGWQGVKRYKLPVIK